MRDLFPGFIGLEGSKFVNRLTISITIRTQQEVDDSDSAHNTMERQRETGLPGGVAPVAKADADRADGAAAAEEERREELLELVEAVRDKARKLLSDWSELKEVFKIPKRELVKMRAEHEREADRAAMARSSFSARYPGTVYPSGGSGGGSGGSSSNSSVASFAPPPRPFHSSYGQGGLNLNLNL